MVLTTTRFIFLSFSAVKRVGSAPATFRVRVPVPDIRINAKGDVVFKERLDNEMPDPFASSPMGQDTRSVVRAPLSSTPHTPT